jgi:sRNA-binding carbon storage regulator CsrA
MRDQRGVDIGGLQIQMKLGDCLVLTQGGEEIHVRLYETKGASARLQIKAPLTVKIHRIKADEMQKAKGH